MPMMCPAPSVTERVIKPPAFVSYKFLNLHYLYLSVSCYLHIGICMQMLIHPWSYTCPYHINLPRVITPTFQ